MRRSGRWNRRLVHASIDEPVKLTLEMLGFNIPKLIEELLIKISNEKRCPCCGRQVRPVITGKYAKAYKDKETQDQED